MRHDRNYVPANNFWREVQNANQEVIPLEPTFEREHLNNYLQYKGYHSLTAAILAPLKSANRRFNLTSAFGYDEPVVGTYVPLTRDLEQAMEGRTPLWCLARACESVVSEAEAED